VGEKYNLSPNVYYRWEKEFRVISSFIKRVYNQINKSSEKIHIKPQILQSGFSGCILFLIIYLFFTVIPDKISN